MTDYPDLVLSRFYVNISEYIFFDKKMQLLTARSISYYRAAFTFLFLRDHSVSSAGCAALPYGQERNAHISRAKEG